MPDDPQRTHTLKCWPPFFDEIVSGRKTFEIRNGLDRDYREGDLLRLREWDPEWNQYTGMQHTVRVTHVSDLSSLLGEGFVGMSLALQLRAERPDREKIAEAIYVADQKQTEDVTYFVPWAEIGPISREPWLALADAAIAALPVRGEPSDDEVRQLRRIVAQTALTLESWANDGDETRPEDLCALAAGIKPYAVDFPTGGEDNDGE